MASILTLTTNSVPIHFYWHNHIVQMLACLLGVSFELCQRDDCRACESMRLVIVRMKLSGDWD